MISYSEVVNEIQGDEMKAVNRLMEIAIEQQRRLKEIKRLTAQLERENRDYNTRMSTMGHICKHIKKEPPFLIVQDGKAYQFSDTYQVHISDIDYLLPSKGASGQTGT